jgi:tryptophan-rich sensory protein
MIYNVSALWYGLLGNILIIMFAILVVFKLFPLVKLSAFLTLPIVIWTAYATLIVLGEMKLQKLI